MVKSAMMFFLDLIELEHIHSYLDCQNVFFKLNKEFDESNNYYQSEND